MSSETLVNRSRRLSEAAADVSWRQWSVVGSMPSVAGKPRAAAIIDPEALVLLSLALRDYERRLWDVLTWWAKAGARLLSVQRFKKLMAEYPQPIRERAREFAWYATRRGGDGRWRSLVGTNGGEPQGPRPRAGKDFGGRPELIEPPALMFRLRSGFGVGAKADLLGFLLGVEGRWSSIRDIAEATHYTPRALSTAANDMAAARILQASRNRPVEYRSEPKAWAQLLDTVFFPTWRYWPRLYAFTAHALTWSDSIESRAPSAYVMSTTARDLVLEHWTAFTLNGIDVPRPEDYPGDTYLEAFGETLDRIAQWMMSNV
jgi:hypothetical protein